MLKIDGYKSTKKVPMGKHTNGNHKLGGRNIYGYNQGLGERILSQKLNIWSDVLP